MPFIQSMFCNYRVNMSMNEPVDLPNFSNTLFFKFIQDASPIVTNETRMRNLQGLMVNLNKISDDVAKLMRNADEIELNVTDLFATRKETQKMLEDAGLTTTTVDSLVNCKIRVLELLNLTQNIDWEVGRFNFSKISGLSWIELLK